MSLIVARDFIWRFYSHSATIGATQADHKIVTELWSQRSEIREVESPGIYGVKDLSQAEKEL